MTVRAVRDFPTLPKPSSVVIAEARFERSFRAYLQMDSGLLGVDLDLSSTLS